MALPPSFSFAHPRQLVLFFRARLLIFSPETRLRGPDTDELLSLLGGTLFYTKFLTRFGCEDCSRLIRSDCDPSRPARGDIFVSLAIFRVGIFSSVFVSSWLVG